MKKNWEIKNFFNIKYILKSFINDEKKKVI